MECVPQILQVEGLYPDVMVVEDGTFGRLIVCVKCIFIYVIYVFIYVFIY